MTELGWERVWILCDAQEVVGHLDLRSAQVQTASHRCELGIGIERIARGQGYGRKLLQTAIDWAKEQGSLAWIDLAVFSQNKTAFELYRKLGFEEVGTFKDYFRVGSSSIDDVQMTLDLHRPPSQG
jgi:RimJ/RimL family protein N-acetyltransferase